MGKLLRSYRTGLRTLYVFAFLNIVMMTYVGLKAYNQTYEIMDLRKQLLEKTCETPDTRPELDLGTLDGFICGTSCKGNTYSF